ncbi:TPA: hypothetical protein QCX07_001959 [Bacillus cytotoxicus]|uniref:hypothetical protein n=1 Tax=Bacillus cytotoxicus TaxID=580165 RepID=UPI000D64FBA4|nr:hypothetical protein [Bacillus cytotoxicus]QTR69119.1 hypothetical protein JC776_17650 [Bacillus cytotoxicus]QTR76902.1 hypothetical protein JC772_16740 [Bacillus cytotoxicus]HDR7208963.1 hypothetical protein [Bacillus cytotoxicus]HDR7213691.1 hypothetical protein [Bacillus cytotoxicus]
MVDEWYWLREKDNPNVMSILRRENYIFQSFIKENGLYNAVYEKISSHNQNHNSTIGLQKKTHVIHHCYQN